MEGEIVLGQLNIQGKSKVEMIREMVTALYRANMEKLRKKNDR